MSPNGDLEKTSHGALQPIWSKRAVKKPRGKKSRGALPGQVLFERKRDRASEERSGGSKKKRALVAKRHRGMEKMSNALGEGLGW